LLLAAGCDEDAQPQFRDGAFSTPEPGYQAVVAPLAAAHCSVDVQGVGTLDVEKDYLPQVIFCENNGADFEALKAQAIAARSVAYYNMETQGSICDSQGCQVFSCNGTADDLHRQAVEATSGLYLSYNSILTYGFYVAGDSSLTPPACVGNDADASTEHYVTYNEGRSGNDVEQTDLGLVISPGDALYGQNRGCMSQWGSRCLENDAGYDAYDILRYYYGEDIEFLQADGPCISEVDDPMGSETTGADSAGTGGGPVTSDSGASSAGSGDGSSDGGPGPGGSSGGDVGGTDGGSSSDGLGGGALPGYSGPGAEDGCGCRSDGRGGLDLVGALLGLVVVAVRRRRP
jgi:hypothetical protein